jgi:hypothetical protein
MNEKAIPLLMSYSDRWSIRESAEFGTLQVKTFLNSIGDVTFKMENFTLQLPKGIRISPHLEISLL